MNSSESKPKQKNIKYLIPFGFVGSLIFIGCCAISVGIASLLGWNWGQDNALRYSILFFYSPQVGTFILAVGSIVCILIAIRKKSLGVGKRIHL